MSAANDTLNSNLKDRLRERIKCEGPITFYDWMNAALYDERDGYYCRKDRIRPGRAGDYRTAPETSPLFAATFARYFAKLYSELGEPKKWTVIEAGAGLGDFAKGFLDSLRSNFPDVFAATYYVIDEAGPAARSHARTKLSEFQDRVEFRSLSQLNQPLADAIIFSNELLDAFPIYRVIGRGGKLRELYVGVADNDAFVWMEGELTPKVAQYCQRTALQLAEGQVHEVNLDAEQFVSRSASLIERGFLITVDYGAERKELLSAPDRFHGTLRAFHRHQLIDDPLSQVGEIDLTTTIDWTQVKEAGTCAGLKAIRFERLDQFLLAEGLLEVLETATQSMSDANALRLRTSAREMIMPTGMAASFQVLVQRKDISQ